MPVQAYPHIYLAGPAKTSGFTSIQSGGGKTKTPPRDRAGHATTIEARLKEAWKRAADRQAVAHGGRTGHYLEFVSSPGFDLAIKSLETRKSGIRLLNVRKEGDGPTEKTYATVFIPVTKSAFFLNRIRLYETEETEKKKPKHAKLVESIDDVRNALLEAFWTDRNKALGNTGATWVEAWLSTDSDLIIAEFRATCAALRIEEHPHRPLLRFPERSVLLISATRAQLSDLIERSDHIAEFRSAREPASFFIQLENKDQAAWSEDLKRRLTINGKGDVAVCILDRGFNDHPLLDGIVAETDRHAAHSEWGKTDDHGHGTLMAGAAALGDLQSHLESGKKVHVQHVLESAKILPPPPAANPQHLWGHVTARGISEAEIQSPLRRRVICMAVTAEEVQDLGKPSSWSAEIDALASGAEDAKQRLIVVSAGNVRNPEEWKGYPTENFTKEVEDPGQSWNALTVGGCTFKTNIVDKTLSGYRAIAAGGSLSPYSRTSLPWPHEKWPIKPELVCEAANVALGPNQAVFDPDDLQLLSTWRDSTAAHFSRFNGTSAAAAYAAWMSAQIHVRYPDAWPETVRGLLVHSAEWTDAMKREFLSGSGKAAYRKLLRVCGYGVPDLHRALYCLKNSLTLVSQAALQPFEKRDGRFVTKDMHLYRLPWPKSALLGLGEAQVKMRVTLSYFVEPGPGEIGWKDRYRYPSHGFRFELNSPGEEEDDFLGRINKQVRDEEQDESSRTDSPNDHWDLGQQRNVGSIHSDIWRGRAADLATSHLIAVRPSIGWWRERHHLGKFDRKARYSLVVSIHTDSQTVDIYTPVATLVGIATPVPIEILT